MSDPTPIVSENDLVPQHVTKIGTRRPVRFRTRPSFAQWGHSIGMWIGGLVGVGVVILLVYAITLF